MNCPKCNHPLTASGKCHACIGKASRAKGNSGQREACHCLNDAIGYEYFVVTGTAQRRKFDKTIADLSRKCPDCNGEGYMHGAVICDRCHGHGFLREPCGEVKYRAGLPAWLWDRGPQRKPSEKWWRWLGRNDFAIIRRIAKPGEAAYEWLVLTTKWGQLPDDLKATALIFHPNDATEDHLSIAVYPAAEWARAVSKGE